MFKIVLLSLVLSGLQALPISRTRGLTKTHHDLPVGIEEVQPALLPNNFRQDTEPSRRFIVDLDIGRAQDYISGMERRTGLLSPPLGNGHGEMDRRHWLKDDTVEDSPVQKNGGGWVRVVGKATLPDGFRQGTEPSNRIPQGYRQGTERFMPIPDGFKQGTEPSVRVPNGFRQGTEPTNPIVHRNVALLKALPVENINTIPDGFRQGTEPSIRIPEGFRQGTERFMPIPDGFKQGTEPSLRVPNGFRQGTEPTNPIVHRNIALLKDLPVENINTIPDGFRQGTEPSIRIPEGFRQGTERFMPIPDGFKQGTEPSLRVPNGFRQGTEPSDPIDHKEVSQSLNALPAKQVKTIQDGFKSGYNPSNQILSGFKPGMGPFMPIRDDERSYYDPVSFRQANELFKSREELKNIECEGEIINRRCYTFNPTPLPFLEAQDSCKRKGLNAELASVTSEDLHSRLISMVTSGGEKERVMTWLGGMVKNHRASWLDGSEWRYSDWMPGQPNINTDKPVCVEMFRMDETWWTAADCDLKRASICSYPAEA